MNSRVVLFLMGTVGPLFAQSPLQISANCTCPPLPIAIIGRPYSVQFSITGLTPNTGFVLDADNHLPPGITFNIATGLLAGTPSVTGKYAISFHVDAIPRIAVAAVNWAIYVYNPLSLASGGALPPGNVGAGYVAWLIQDGGPPYTFKVTAGALPPGLSFENHYAALYGTPLAQGVYSFTGTTADSSDESVTSQYAVLIGPPGDFYVTSAGVNFEALSGGPVQTYPVGVQTSDLQPVQFSVSIPANQAGVVPAWLKVTPTSGSTPAQLSVQADPGKLARGAYQGQIQLTPGGKSPITIPVTLNVADPKQSFGAAPAAIKVTYPANADLTKAVTTALQVTNTGGAAVSVAASVTPPAAGSPWFTIAPALISIAAGQTQTFSVTVVGANTYAGTHFGTIELKSSSQIVDIPVQLSIVGTVLAPSLWLTPQATMWFSWCDPDRPVSGTIEVGELGAQNPGPDTAYTLSLQGFNGGLQVQPTQGNNSAHLYGVIRPCQLGLGKHVGFLELSAPRMTPAKIFQMWNVTIGDWKTGNDYGFGLTSSGSNPVFDSSGVVLVAQPGQNGLVTSQITVTGSDDQPMQFTVSLGSDAPAGVSVSPTRGEATGTPTTVTVTLDPTKAPPGVINCDDLVWVQLEGDYHLRVPRAFAGVVAQFSAGLSAVEREAGVSPAASACTATQILVVPTNTPSYFSQTLDWPMTIQARLLDNCGQAVSDASVTASFSNGDPGLALNLTDPVKGIYGATWRPGKPASSLTLTLRAFKTGLPVAARTVYGAVLDDPGAVIVAANGVVNNLNVVLGAPLAPGTVTAIYGRNLASATMVASTVPLPTKLADTQVLIGGIAAPLFYISPGQINVQIPVEIPANSSQDVMVLANGNVSIPQTIQLGSVNPGIAAYATGRAIAQHGDTTYVTPGSPARPEEWIVLYLVGMGATNPAVGSNQITPSLPLTPATVQPKVTIDGVAATVNYAGLTPGSIGLYQINCQVPKGARSGDLPLVVIQGDVAANAVTIPVSR